MTTKKTDFSAFWALFIFWEEQVFEGATTYACLLFLSKLCQKEFTFSSVQDPGKWVIDNNNSSVGTIAAKSVNTKPWVFTTGPATDLIKKLKDGKEKLGDVTDRIFQGFKTGADSVFILEKQNGNYFSKQLKRQVQLEEKYLFPLYKYRNFKRYNLLPHSKVIIFPYNNGTLIDWNTIKSSAPLTANYLLECKGALEKRERGRLEGKSWYCYSRTQALAIMTSSKIITADLNPHANYCFDKPGTVCFTGGAAGGYGIVLPDEL